MSRLLSLALITMLSSFSTTGSGGALENVWRIQEKSDPFSEKVKLSVHVEYRTKDSSTGLPVFAALDITSQPNPHSSVAAIGLISHYSPEKPQPIDSSERIISLQIDAGPTIDVPAYYQTDMGSAFGTRHWYLFDLDCEVIKQLANGQKLSLDSPEDSIIKLYRAEWALRQVIPVCFPING